MITRTLKLKLTKIQEKELAIATASKKCTESNRAIALSLIEGCPERIVGKVIGVDADKVTVRLSDQDKIFYIADPKYKVGDSVQVTKEAGNLNLAGNLSTEASPTPQATSSGRFSSRDGVTLSQNTRWVDDRI